MSNDIHSSIFRAYDIRGIVGETLTENNMAQIGRALASYAQDRGEKRFMLARDGRLSSPLLADVLSKTLLASGCDVVDIGVVPTPLLYYSTFLAGSRTGVMVTGSHNPAEYNGLKMIVGGETLSGDTIQDLYQLVLNPSVSAAKEAERHELEMVERYITHIVRDVKLARPLKIVVDCGNGVAGKIAPELFRQMGCEVSELFCELDGRFPNHHPDPSQAENLIDLIAKVKEVKADLGLAFDGDGDRIGVITNQGEIIWPDRLLMLLSQALLKKVPGAKIIYDVKCSSHLEKIILEAGGIPIMWKTGHSLIKAKLAETQALLAGEMSGHIFFKEGWYGFDDALYAGARLLQIIADQSDDAHTLFQTIPNSVNTPELKLFVAENEKFSVMNKLIAQADFHAAKVNTIDGLRVNFDYGWGLVRPSNTTPCLVFRFEAETTSGLEQIKNDFRKNLLALKPDWVLPF